MSRHYETLCIVNPDIGEAEVNVITEKAKSLLESNNSLNVEIDDWGRRRLAYPIQKKNEGHYMLLTYTTTPEVPKELERLFKYNEDVYRYQTIVLKSRAKKAPKVEAKPEASVAAPAEAKAEAAPAPAEVKAETAPAAAEVKEDTAGGES